MGNIIFMFMAIALILAFGLIVDNSSVKGNARDQPFSNKWANKMYSMSYGAPFTWFVDEKGENPKTEQIKKDLFYANLSGFFNYRSFTVFRILVLIGSVMGYFIVNLMVNNANGIAKVLFNLNNNGDITNTSGTSSDASIMLMIIFAVVAFLPTLVLRNKASYYRYSQVKDLPVIQLFIILMLRSKRPLNEIIYALSRLETRYKEAFNVGYRIFLRDKKEGFAYLENKFDGTKFKDSIGILKGLDEYSKSETIKMLENNMEEITTENESIQKKKDVKKMLLSQLTLVLPFLAIILLAFAPLIMYGIAIFQKSSVAFG